MKKLTCILFSLVLLWNCKGVDRPEKPKNLIGEQKMTEILTDLYILNAAKGVNRKLMELNGLMPMEYIYKKYAIDSSQFAQSNTYYSFEPKTYTRIMDQVKLALEEKKNVLEDQSKNDLLKANPPLEEPLAEE